MFSGLIWALSGVRVEKVLQNFHKHGSRQQNENLVHALHLPRGIAFSSRTVLPLDILSCLWLIQDYSHTQERKKRFRLKFLSQFPYSAFSWR
jgi:hypothetical protein